MYIRNKKKSFLICFKELVIDTIDIFNRYERL